MPTATTYQARASDEAQGTLVKGSIGTIATGETIYLTKSRVSLLDVIWRDFNRRGSQMTTIFGVVMAIFHNSLRIGTRKFIVIRPLDVSDPDVGGEAEPASDPRLPPAAEGSQLMIARNSNSNDNAAT